jgi:predicted kinase
LSEKKKYRTWTVQQKLEIVLAELARHSDLAMLGSDRVRKEVAGISPSTRTSPEHYSAEFSRAIYSELGRRAAAEVRAHGGAIVDATCRRRRDREAFRASFGAAAPLVLVECRAPESVLAERALRRERDPERVSDANLAVVLREGRRWEPLDEVPADEHVAVRTDCPGDEVIEDILLDRRLGGPPECQ